MVTLPPVSVLPFTFSVSAPVGEPKLMPDKSDILLPVETVMLPPTQILSVRSAHTTFPPLVVILLINIEEEPAGRAYTDNTARCNCTIGNGYAA